MAYLYFAVPPQGAAATTPIETGVFFRMGTYANDPGYPVDEYSQMPASFKALNTTAQASEGIFITSSGTYIVNALDEGHIEIENGVTQALTGDKGSMTTTVKEGNISMEIANGAFNLEGHSFFNVTSENGDIGISAKAGKVSSKGNYVYTNTYGSYIVMVYANKTSGTIGPDTNVSISLNIALYGAVLFSGKLLVISFKIASATATLASVSLIGFTLDFNMEASAIVTMENKTAWLYIKYRGIQLESDSKKTSATALLKKDQKMVGFFSGLSKANVSPLKAAFGLRTHIPGV
jgi:hypothetical protein